jgi:hypothetical protein
MPEKTINPYLVLAAGLVLPGSGHVLLGKPQRGLIFLFFIIILGWTSVRIMPDTASFLLRHAGGFLVYGLSALDAYKIARVRQVTQSFKPE